MATKRMNIAWVLLGLFAVAFLLGGCNTWKGLGRDVERTGEKIQGEP